MSELSATWQQFADSEAAARLAVYAPAVLLALGGGSLLLYGRRLVWLLLGGVGFVVGLLVATRFAAPAADWSPLVAGAVGGFAGVLLAFFLQGVVLTVVGGLLGAFVTVVLLSGWGEVPWTLVWVLVVIGSILGAVLLRRVYAGALIVITSFVGARMLVEALIAVLVLSPDLGRVPLLWQVASPGPWRLIALVALTLMGVIVQATRKSGREARRDREQKFMKDRQRELEKEVRRLARDR